MASPDQLAQAFDDLEVGEACRGEVDRNANRRNRPPLPYSGTMYRTDVPFMQSRAGTRTFDFNTDGLAHIGLLPDFLKDLAHVGMTDAQLDPLFSSAEAFLRMWEDCEARGAALTAGEPVS